MVSPDSGDDYPQASTSVRVVATRALWEALRKLDRWPDFRSGRWLRPDQFASRIVVR